MSDTLPLSVKPPRLLSLDAYRGLVMLLLMFTAAHGDWMLPIEAVHEDSPWLLGLLRQGEHVHWQGIVLWDMIQPAFMFMVGVSMAYSYVSRERQGHSHVRMLGHACYRALALVLLGVFLRSLWSDSTYWTLEDVVSQIGLGYVGLFLLWKRPWRVQLGCALGLLLIYGLLFALWPLPAESYDYAAVQGEKIYAGYFAHWNKNAHPGHYFDQWLLNLFSRESPFTNNDGGYNTLNFIPALATMIFGLMAGELLRSDENCQAKFRQLLIAGVIMTAIGYALQVVGICPIVKKIWTPSFGLVASGLCLIGLAILYGVIDILQWQRWAWPAMVVGRNSTVAYCMTFLVTEWLLKNLLTHLGLKPFLLCGENYQPLLETCTVGLCMWLICYWMDRRKIYIRI